MAETMQAANGSMAGAWMGDRFHRRRRSLTPLCTRGDGQMAEEEQARPNPDVDVLSTRSDGHSAKKWQSTDAGIQSHALKAVAPFLSCLSNEMLRLPPIKESVSDIVVLLEGALQTKNVSIVIQAADVSLKDIILEAQSNEELKCRHGSCQLSTLHVHSHKIVLSMSCDYLRALFHSGMHESFSDVIKVLLGWQALDKLVHWFYSGELPKVAPDCQWKNLSSEEQLSQLSSLSEFWFMEGVKEDSLDAVTSCLSSSTDAAAVKFVAFAAGLGQWDMVEAGIRSVAHLYPRLRDSGQLERLDDELLNMLRTEYVRYSQHGAR
ncbi:hypothetical protein ACQ4PT_029470 [Festuca glaucescens]